MTSCQSQQPSSLIDLPCLSTPNAPPQQARSLFLGPRRTAGEDLHLSLFLRPPANSSAAPRTDQACPLHRVPRVETVPGIVLVGWSRRACPCTWTTSRWHASSAAGASDPVSVCGVPRETAPFTTCIARQSLTLSLSFSTTHTTQPHTGASSSVFASRLPQAPLPRPLIMTCFFRGLGTCSHNVE